jgi:hypothetical protein
MFYESTATPLSSRPGFPATQHWTKPRVRLSLKERRITFANATKFNRKSGGAQPRDLQFSGPLLEMFFDRAYPDFLPRSTGHDHVCGFH